VAQAEREYNFSWDNCCNWLLEATAHETSVHLNTRKC